MAETFFDSRYGDLPLRGFDSDGLVEQDIALNYDHAASLILAFIHQFGSCKCEAAVPRSLSKRLSLGLQFPIPCPYGGQITRSMPLADPSISTISNISSRWGWQTVMQETACEGKCSLL